MSRQRPRLLARVTGLVGGGALGLSALGHAPWWAYLGAVLVALAPAALPQESEHRRDFYRDYFRHRERMVRIRQQPPAAPSGPPARWQLEKSEPSGERMPDG
ncbi:hypothetical protein ACFW81_07475 [Streptomyces angustmyceticus]|uniref:hypothetical protein n=1 Tax=Streptomyces angustmyceticus TaxID=285578 RepID=UPI0021AE863F|nr:hypothetical protein [Streptomyces angustmyceticus]